MLGRLHKRSWFAAALLALAGCADQLPPAPRIEAIHPRAAFEGNATVISVVGSFPPAVHASYRDPRRSGLDTGYSLWLRDVQLTDVQYADGTTLTAVAPSDLEPGSYDVLAADPTNRWAFLPGAFEVLSLAAKPTRLFFFTAPQVVAVNTCSRKVTVESVNEAGIAKPVADTLLVSVSVDPPGAVELFADSGCETPLGPLALTYGDSKVNLYFRALVVGSARLTATAEGLAPASQDETLPGAPTRPPLDADLGSHEAP